MKKLAMILAVAGLMLAGSDSARAVVPNFQGLGYLPDGGKDSVAWGISGDGSVAVGEAQPASGWGAAFRWTAASQMVGLGDLPGGINFNVAQDASTDGSVIVGCAATDPDEWYLEAFRWTASGMVNLGGLGQTSDYNFISEARAVSDDGSVVVGQGYSTSGYEAFRWTASGMVGLGDLSGGDFASAAYGVSGDGLVVVGEGTSGSGYEAYRRTTSGMVGLGDLSGGDFESAAYGASADGSVIVGYGTSASGMEAFRWTASGMVGLSDLPGGVFGSIAYDVSADGSVVVGAANLDMYIGELGEAFIWDADNGMRSLKDVLTDCGLDLSGWVLLSANGISADGLTIAGEGYSPSGYFREAWIATVPEPGTMALLGLGGGLALLRRRRK